MGNVNYSDHPVQDDRNRGLNRYNTVDQIAHDHMVIYL